MNSLVAKMLIQLMIDTYQKFTDNTIAAVNLRKKAHEYEEKHQIEFEPAEDEEFPRPPELSAKHRKVVRKMLQEARVFSNPEKLITDAFKSMQKIINDKKVNEVKYAVKKATSGQELSQFLNAQKDKYTIVSTKYFTGNEKGELILCCAIEYVEKPKKK